MSTNSPFLPEVGLRLLALLTVALQLGCVSASQSTPPASLNVSQARVQLGKDLFSDPRLSADGSVSCSSCHDVAAGGADGRKTAKGIGGAIGPINTPTVLNAGLNFAQFWDGRAATLEDQVHGPITNPAEMGDSWSPVLARLNTDRQTVKRFRAIYMRGPNATDIADAIATYERALLTLNSPFDRYQQGDTAAISQNALQGFSHFERLGCSSCHQGRAFGGNMYQRFGVMTDYFQSRGTPPTVTDLGRYNVTKREEDRYKFKVPTLRNVALTQPYFHDGSTETLEDAVQTMVRAQIGLPVSDEQVSQIVAFLITLTGEVDENLR